MIITGFHGTHKKNEYAISQSGFESSAEEEYLGAGVYFFEDAEFCHALDEAICFCQFVKYIDRKDIIVFKATVNSEKILDLVSNIEHRKYFDEVKNRIKLRLKFSSEPEKKIEEFRIFNLIDRDNCFEVVRAIIEAAKEDKESFSYVIRRPQIQICVKKAAAIKDIDIAWRHTIGRYRSWTTE
jgi:hypothetical protein